MSRRILIGVVIADCHIDFQCEILRGIITQAFKSNCDIAVISPLHDFSVRSVHKDAEKSILDLILSDGCLELRMNVCPSLSKALDNDAGACRVYCDHCPGWVCRVIAMAGYYEVYDLVSRTEPTCVEYIYADRARAEAKYAEVLALRGPDLVRNNFRYFDK